MTRRERPLDTAPNSWDVTPSDDPMAQSTARMFEVFDAGTIVLKNTDGGVGSIPATSTWTITEAMLPYKILQSSDTVMETGTTCTEIKAYQ